MKVLLSIQTEQKISLGIHLVFPHQWMHVDISSIYRTSALKFKLKANELPKLQAILFAYTGNKRRLQKILDENHFIDNGSGIYEAYLLLNH